MAKASPEQNVLEGEFSPLAEGRTDSERYKRAMRFMQNMVPCRTGPGISRSGTYFENRCIEPAYPSKLLPFEYNEDETLVLEFGHYKLRFHYEYTGPAAHREVQNFTVLGVNPFQFRAVGNDYKIGEHVTFIGCPAQLNINGQIFRVTASAPDGTVTTDGQAGSDPYAPLATMRVAAVYEIATPYSRADVQNLRLVQELNICYLFCFKTDGSGDYYPYYLSRYGAFQWTLLPFPLRDGPYMDINTTTTYLVPSGTGTWVANMTSNSTPAPFAASASSEVVGHEAWRAFDNDIDSYWEGNASQEGWLMYQFEGAFVNSIPVFTAPTHGAMTIWADTQAVGHPAWLASDASSLSFWQSTGWVPQNWYIDLGAVQTVREYAIRATVAHPEYAPRNFTLAGSAASGGPWTTVDTRVNHKWTSGQRKQLTVQAPAAFRYYRIQTTAVNQKRHTVKHPAVGKKGKKGYKPAYTTTTITPAVVSFTQAQMSYGPGTPKCIDGYTIYLGRYAKGQDVIDHAPKTWYFEGLDHAGNWNLLDSQQGYVGWPNYRSQYFPLKNHEAYKAYRIRIKTVYTPGDVNPRIGRLVMSSPDAPILTLTATSKTGINNDQGFLITDVGRQIRVRDADGIWRWKTITSVNSARQISLAIRSSDPLILEAQVKFWRLGLWSNTTGWPICGVLHEDRLFVGGASGFPDHVVGSYSGNHMFFQQVANDDTVLDAHAIVMRCNSRYMSRVVWLKSCIEALRVGTGKNEFVVSTPTDEALSSRNIKIRVTTQRGSAVHESAFVDNDVVFLQEGGRALYTLNFTYTLGGALYKSTLMSKLGAHLLEPQVTQIVYQQEPHSVIWGRRTDGSVVAMTYSTDDDIFGGHRHDFSAYVQDLCTVYSPTDHQHSLWIVAQRLINGAVVNYIERLHRFWDYGDVLEEDATFTDSALRYYGTAATSKVYGLTHLEGQYLHVLADNITYLNQGPVVNGMLTLQRAATNIVVGIPMIRQAEIVTPEVGAQDGTAQGKSKRPHSVVLRLWESARGEVGRWDEDHGELMWTPCEYNFPADEHTQDVTLRTCLTKTIVLPGGYGTLGTVAFRQQEPLPFNVAGVYPQLVVEDER